MNFKLKTQLALIATLTAISIMTNQGSDMVSGQTIPSATPTSTLISTPLPSLTPTLLPSKTPTLTPFITPTPPQTMFPTPTLTETPTPGQTLFSIFLGIIVNEPVVVLPEPTSTPTPTPTSSATPSPVPTITLLPSSTPTIMPTNTLAPSPTQTPQPVATSTPIPVATSTPNSFGVCPCNGNTLNCSDFGTQPESQACFDHCMLVVGFDIHRLDSNGDGIACESLPQNRLVIDQSLNGWITINATR